MEPPDLILSLQVSSKRSKQSNSSKAIHMSVVSPTGESPGQFWKEPKDATPTHNKEVAVRSVIMGGAKSTIKKHKSHSNLGLPKSEAKSHTKVAEKHHQQGKYVTVQQLSPNGSKHQPHQVIEVKSTISSSAMIWSPPTASMPHPIMTISTVMDSPTHQVRGDQIYVQSPAPQLGSPPDRLDLRKRRGRKPTNIDLFLVPLTKG